MFPDALEPCPAPVTLVIFSCYPVLPLYVHGTANSTHDPEYEVHGYKGKGAKGLKARLSEYPVMFGMPDDNTVTKMLVAQLTQELVATEHKDLFLEAKVRAEGIVNRLTSAQRKSILADSLQISMSQFMAMQNGKEITPVKIMDMVENLVADQIGSG